MRNDDTSGLLRLAGQTLKEEFNDFIKKFGDADAVKLSEEIKNRRIVARSCFLLHKKDVMREAELLELIQGHIGDRLVRDSLNAEQFTKYSNGVRFGSKASGR